MKVIKKIFKYFTYSLLSILVLFSLYTLIVTKVLNKPYINIFGYTYFVVASGSMSGTIEVNDIVIVKIADNYSTDDIITFNDDGAFITHRVMRIEKERVITRGDVNNLDDDPVDKKDVIGRVVFVVSISLILKIFAFIAFIFLIYLIINFDKIFKKYITKEDKKKKDVETPLEYTQVIKVGAENKIPLVNQATCEIKRVGNSSEQDFLNLVLKVLKLKKKKLKLTKQGSLKLKYVYEIAVTTFVDPDAVLECFKNVPFDELYDYDFEEIMFTKDIQDRLYDMPMYIYLKLLAYSLLYDENEYFDAIFKVLKYRIRVDRDEKFIHDNRRVGEVLILIEKIIVNVGHEENFELKKIRDRVNTNKEIRSIETKKND